MQLDRDRMPLRRALQRGEDPGGERVGVDGDRERRDPVLGDAQFLLGLVLEQGDLTRHPHEDRARVGRAGRLRAHQQHATDLPLERGEALTDGGRGDAESTRRRIEGALLDDREEGGEMVAVEPHH